MRKHPKKKNPHTQNTSIYAQVAKKEKRNNQSTKTTKTKASNMYSVLVGLKRTPKPHQNLSTFPPLTKQPQT